MQAACARWVANRLRQGFEGIAEGFAPPAPLCSLPLCCLSAYVCVVSELCVCVIVCLSGVCMYVCMMGRRVQCGSTFPAHQLYVTKLKLYTCECDA